MGNRSRGPQRDPWYPPKLALEREACPHCGKAVYASRRQAESWIKRIERDSRRRGTLDTALRAYECPSGEGWHVAHRVSQGHRTGAIPTRVQAATASAA